MTTPQSTGHRGLVIKAVVGLLITGFLFLFLLRYVDLSQLAQMLARTRWPQLGLAAVLWSLLYALRAARFRLLAPETPYLTMLWITSVHGFLLRLLPLRTGELSYAFLVRKAGTAGLGESLLGLLLVRVLDATVVVVLFSVALALDRGVYLGDRRTGLLLAGGAAVLGLVLVLGLRPLLRLGLRVARWLGRVSGLERRAGVQRTLAKVEQAVADFSRLGLARLLQLSLVSVVLWLLTFGAFFAIMRAFSMPVGLAQTVLGSTAAVVTGFLPIGGIGSFGTMEAGWALGFVLVGLQREQAIASGFGVSFATFACAIFLGVVGWIGLTLGGSKRQTSG